MLSATGAGWDGTGISGLTFLRNSRRMMIFPPGGGGSPYRETLMVGTPGGRLVVTSSVVNMVGVVLD